jgi:hypothetical protein
VALEQIFQYSLVNLQELPLKVVAVVAEELRVALEVQAAEELAEVQEQLDQQELLILAEAEAVQELHLLTWLVVKAVQESYM